MPEPPSDRPPTSAGPVSGASGRQDLGFPRRGWGELAMLAGVGGLAAALVAWSVAGAAGALLGTGEDSSIDRFWAVALHLCLGVPLTLADEGVSGSLRVPLTLFVAIPIAALVAAGFLASRQARPADAREGAWLGALVAIVFAVVLALAGPMVDARYQDSGRSSLGPELPWSLAYGLLVGVPAGALGGALAVGGPRRLLAGLRGGPLAAIVREGLLALALASAAMLVVGAVVIGLAIAQDDGDASGKGIFYAITLIPAVAIGALLLAQGVSFEVGASLGGLVDDQSARLWDLPGRYAITIGVGAVVVLAVLLRAGYRLARGARASAA